MHATTDRLKVLFVAEGATLAHVARPLVLARGLDPGSCEVTLARPASYAWMTADVRLQVCDVDCQPADVFARKLDRGAPLFDYPTLRRYVDEDLDLIDRFRPDVVVGDFRLSLSVSARLRKVPYITICDAYWSPELPLDPPLPVLPFTRIVPIPLATPVFRLATRFAFPYHAHAMERLRAHYGLPGLGHDLSRVYTDADLRLFANIPALFPDVREGGEAGFLGPIAWSPPPVEEMDLAALPRPLVFVTMGSSGDTSVLGGVVRALAEVAGSLVVATAGRVRAETVRLPKTFVFDFVSGEQLCRYADLVVCNGGSPITNLALTHGVPVVGIVRNMDQFLNMRAIVRQTAGTMVRADRIRPDKIQALARNLITDKRWRSNAFRMASSARAALTERSLQAYIDGLVVRSGR